ncbi:small RNA 2'-O-methyltransferase [Centroberyx gerrardi]|uniref:small RNA 2'-O-methyltransferase n=1 Tax=Centroberyx gerrardi TaxID=166262 RepID=UPI003AAE2ECC
MVLLFSPPLHRQRHQFVIDFIKRNKPKKVVDLGCNECTLLRKLKFHREIELLVGVDINSAAMTKKMYELAPISTEYLLPSYDQLSIELYQGSVTQKDGRLRGFDLVTSIELIEHLHLADVERFSEVLFGYMAPVSVIVSTPNSEFNPLLPGLTGFRHSDHKFEWTRAEFQSWALQVCLEHGYEVQFTGVGLAPPGQRERVGFCSQIGVFHRLSGRDDARLLPGDDAHEIFSYTLLYSIAYPSLRDNNVLRRILVSEVLYWAEQLKRGWMEEKTGEGEEASALCQTQGGGGERLSERQAEMEEKQTGSAGRCVCVPLAKLWSCCPRVQAMSGSVSHLSRFLLDDPLVKLTQDGSAVLVDDQEQDQEEEEYDDLEDTGCTEASQCSLSAVQQEDWEVDL